jgi:hypothetical protein
MARVIQRGFIDGIDGGRGLIVGSIEEELVADVFELYILSGRVGRALPLFGSQPPFGPRSLGIIVQKSGIKVKVRSLTLSRDQG